MEAQIGREILPEVGHPPVEPEIEHPLADHVLGEPPGGRWVGEIDHAGVELPEVTDEIQRTGSVRAEHVDSGAQGGNSSTVSSKLAGGVRAVYSTFSAFAAVKTDGSVVTWGTAASGGNSSAVAAQLTAGVEVIYSHASAFAALKSDGSVVSWGAAGDSSAVAAQLASGVRSLASPFDEEQSAPGAAAIRQSRVMLSSADAITVGGAQRSIIGFAASTQASGSIDAMSTSSVTTANETLRRADVALQSITTQRARVGATRSRFDSLIGDLNTAGSNLTASRSRITDADIAAETAMLTRAQIVQQAGQAMLAQANTNAQMILALLRSDR